MTLSVTTEVTEARTSTYLRLIVKGAVNETVPMLLEAVTLSW
jgi:hypothetical protein